MSSTSYFTGAPVCPQCCQKTTRKTTQTDTPDKDIGNFSRPYYKCTTSACRDFICFDDYRGITDDIRHAVVADRLDVLLRRL